MEIQEQTNRLRPTTKSELQDIIRQRIEAEGDRCNLNDIDISLITDMSWLFEPFSRFNGDISGWDVSNVTNMCGMFSCCHRFNRPLEQWNVSRVRNMCVMFWDCRKFNQPLERWNIGADADMCMMFGCCPCEPPSWFKRWERDWRGKMKIISATSTKSML